MNDPSNIDVVVDINSLRLGTRNITGEVFLRINRDAFPETRWNDFVVIILGWWLRCLRELGTSGGIGDETVLYFMDGPFRLAVRKIADGGVTITGVLETQTTRHEVLKATCQLRDLLTPILTSAELVHRECDNRGWKTDDSETLLSEIEKTRSAGL